MFTFCDLNTCVNLSDFVFLFLDGEGFEPGEIAEKKGDAWEGEDEDDDELKVWHVLLFISLHSL
jgi:hypothetical protein